MLRFLWSILVLSVCVLGQTSPTVPPAFAVNNTNNTSANSGGSGTISPEPLSPLSPRNQASAERLPDTPPLPKGKTTLVGGTVGDVDWVRDSLTLRIFGGGHTKLLFDERTQVFREGAKVNLDELKNGQIAYVDTTLDGKDVFARTIRLASGIESGQSKGQVLSFDSGSKELVLRDSLAPRSVRMRLGTDAEILRGDQAASIADLQSGTIVDLSFTRGSDGVPTIRRISLLASVGSTFVFAGQIEYIDLPRGLVVVTDPRDNKNYEVSFDSSSQRLMRNLHQGANVTLQTTFDGTHYVVQSVTQNSQSPANQ